MKRTITTVFTLLVTTVGYSQDSQGTSTNDDEFFKIEAVRGLIGDQEHATLLFIGDAVNRDSVAKSNIKDLWTKLDVKADYVIVFSEEMKNTVSTVSKSNVLLASGSYEDYFVQTWRSMKKWFLIEYNSGAGGSFVSSSEAIDLIVDRD